MPERLLSGGTKSETFPTVQEASGLTPPPSAKSGWQCIWI